MSIAESEFFHGADKPASVVMPGWYRSTELSVLKKTLINLLHIVVFIDLGLNNHHPLRRQMVETSPS